MKPEHSTLRCGARFAVVIAGAAIAWCIAANVHACPTCKDALVDGNGQGSQLAAGFYYSILLMMSLPFIILSALGALAYRAVRRAQDARDAVSSAQAPVA